MSAALLIVADDQRYETIHALENPHIHTPVPDSLAQRGAAFHSTYITGSLTPAICMPSRACLHTGARVLRACDPMRIGRCA